MKSKPRLVAAVDADLIKAVRERAGISRVQLARQLDIAPSTAGIYVDRLVREGFLLESKKTSHRLGRPATMLQLNPGGGRFIGIDFEARNIMSAAVDFSQKQLAHFHTTIRARDSVDQIVGKIENAIEEVIDGGSGRLLGIGVAVPGVVDPARGRSLGYAFIKGWENVELGPRLSARFKTPVYLENNVRCMALAELWFGQAQRLRHFICIAVRSGVGAGIIVDGRLLRGTTNEAGEVGNWNCPVPRGLGNGPCRGRDWSWDPAANLDHVASLSAILALVQDKVARGEKTSLPRDREIGVPDLLDAVASGDALATACVRSAARVHGWLIAQLSALFDPSRIIFTWPMAELGEFFLSQVRESALRFASNPVHVEITGSTLGRFNGALGAAALALHEWKPKR